MAVSLFESTLHIKMKEENVAWELLKLSVIGTWETVQMGRNGTKKISNFKKEEEEVAKVKKKKKKKVGKCIWNLVKTWPQQFPLNKENLQKDPRKMDSAAFDWFHEYLETYQPHY